MAQILPSIFGANILSLQDELRFLEEENTEILHVDLMDGTFVNNIAFGPNQISAMKKASKMTFDVHMMLANPERHIDDVINTGAEMISVHYESTPHVHFILQKIKKAGRKAGVVINPGTPESVLEYLLDDIDYILIMTINPGQPGQTFIEKSLEKIKKTREMIAGRHIQIEVDGGVNLEIAKKVQEAGADLIVVGGALFNDNPKASYQALKSVMH
ncbi:MULTISPECIES: ribulose-phosphate 3-epimerase [Enterobacterales]|jgi:ribulose-phosphate 3-epimerase|uniref:Ribulose-phosphate 3-epimerase n=1 Tax=Rahnella bonaserana TaxID=2816248 RepID=A0ABS6LUH8_9GAMM|nr:MULTISPECIES: ribulose-phosphate 3-epimerase [Enterobacterales]HBR5596497.1 ribulose-phosphate 3-epimerase [Klebsiella pneumoniae]KAB1578652.1 ribulose-phosphate 3-epimerase [Serratia marcescens]KAB7897397.1 ribulose-phosphate 3-epimerase [Rouxiella sp. S1S-2]MBU9848984.1 ribulose-phosphate 3-epimerase [Rahnella aceris]MBU9855750.1 ribulose-phosphate 3-epimerase [Rahnella bonaserana]